ncbi:hypothetical protein FBZ91_1086 [Nitrospirillum viridazoti]|nr:hypothetical protein FBZ91_1086 [Nitrospirillum amazonense]
MLGAPAGRVVIDHRRRIAAPPGPVIPRQRPEVAALGPAPARIEHRRLGLVNEQLAGAQQVGAHQPPDRRQLGGGVAHPEGQRRAVDHDALPGEALGLPVQGNVIGVFGDQHGRHQALGRQAALDQAGRRRGLDHGARTGATAIAGPAGHDHLVAGRHHVQPLRPVLADHVHGPLAARAGRALRRHHHLDARQVWRQRPPCLAALTGSPPLQRGIIHLRHRLGLSPGLLDVLQRQVELVGIKPFRPRAELHALQLADEVAQPVVQALDPPALRPLGLQRLRQRQNLGAQGLDIGRKGVGIDPHDKSIYSTESATWAIDPGGSGATARLSDDPAVERATGSSPARPTVPPLERPTAASPCR